MGYLLKTELGEYKVFYSEPEQGHYRGDSVCFTKEEYDNHQTENPNELHNDFVWLDGWYDASNGFTNEAHGVLINEFIADCILQGKTIEVDTPIEYEIVSEA